MKIHLLSFFLAMFCISSVSSVQAQNPKKIFKEAEKAKRSKDFKLAISKYSKVIDLDSGNEVAYVYRAYCYEQTDALNLAANDYLAAFNISGEEDDLSFKAALLYFDIKAYDDALKCADYTIGIYSMHLEALALKAEIQLEQKEYEAAYKTASIGLDAGKTTQLIYLKGVTAATLGYYEEAEKLFKKVLFKENEHYQATVWFAYVLIQQNEVKNAKKQLDKAHKINPEYPQFYKVRAGYFEAIADETSAMNDYERYLKLCPEDFEVQYKLADRFVATTDYENAIQYYTSVLNKNSTEYKARYERAKCYQSLVQNEQAIMDYEALVADAENISEAKDMVHDAELQLFELKKMSSMPGVGIEIPVVQKEK